MRMLKKWGGYLLAFAGGFWFAGTESGQKVKSKIDETLNKK